MTFISNYPSVTESDIKGKPYITVSPKGIANGLSDIPNDGADFGPDTMLGATDPSQIGPPYTQTYGLAEATYYQYYVNYKKIFLMPGIYWIGAQIPLYPRTYIEGSQNWGTENNTSQPSTTQMSTLYLITNFGTNTVMPFTGYTSSNEYLMSITLKNIHFDAGSHTAKAWIDFSVLPEGANPSILEDLWFGNGKNMTYDLILDHAEEVRLIRCRGMNVSVAPYGGSAYIRGGSAGNIVVGAGLMRIEGVDIGGSVILNGGNYGGSLSAPAIPITYLDSVWFDNLPASPFYIGSSKRTQYVYCNNCHFDLNQNNGSPYPIFNLASGISSGSVYAVFNNISIGSSNIASSGFVPIPMFASGITGRVILNNVKVDQTTLKVPAVFSDWMNWLADYNPKDNASIFSITTPAVPASGTAITNNNPFSVDIYITNAGSVSSYQINNLTISAGLSVGQKITLAPGWSLTLTYTTAPTWTWTYHA
jgi:hypothetical protein